VDVDVKLVCADLREDGAMPLALSGRPRTQENTAGWQHTCGRSLERAKPGSLDVVCKSDPDVAPLLASLLLALAERLPTGLIKRHLLAFRIITAVVGERGAIAINQPDLVGHGMRWNQ